MPFLAKSNGETIIQHTNNLLTQYKLLKHLYPNILTDQQWHLLQLACKYHDLGKINDTFQKAIITDNHDTTGFPHALLSITMIKPRQLKDDGYSTSEIKALIYAIALHHERDFSQLTEEQYRNEVDKLSNPASNFDFAKLSLPDNRPKLLSRRYYRLGTRLDPDDDSYPLYILLKGLLVRLDYAASGHYRVEATSTRDDLSQLIKQSQPNFKWNTLQTYLANHQNENLVIIGQTGIGKTEAAIKWLNNEKGLFVLPQKAMISATYQRLHDRYHFKDNQIGMLDSDTANNLLKLTSDQKLFTEQLNETKNFSKQLTITSIDQIFNFVSHYRGYELKLATASRCNLVIDEIQMYDPELLANLIKGLKEIQDLGGHFLIMTATLSPFVLKLMQDAGLKFQQHAPFLDEKLDHRHSVKICPSELTSQEIVKQYQSNTKLLVVCNTVKKAQALVNDLSKTNLPVHLIHSRFTRVDRQVKEQAIQKFSNDPDRSGIWIGTQVVEASLDLDFDCLLTEASELNSLFQRMGRCYRRRNFEQSGYNIYIYTQNSSGTTGRFKVVDTTMHKLTLNALKNVDGPITEEDKLSLLNAYYTFEKLQHSKFYQQYALYFDDLNNRIDANISKKEATKNFRHIDNTNVIPEAVFDSHKDELINSASITTDKQQSFLDRIQARDYIAQYCVSAPNYLIKNDWALVDNPELNNADYLILSKHYHYDSISGLSYQYTEN